MKNYYVLMSNINTNTGTNINTLNFSNKLTNDYYNSIVIALDYNYNIKNFFIINKLLKEIVLDYKSIGKIFKFNIDCNIFYFKIDNILCNITILNDTIHFEIFSDHHICDEYDENIMHLMEVYIQKLNVKYFKLNSTIGINYKSTDSNIHYIFNLNTVNNNIDVSSDFLYLFINILLDYKKIDRYFNSISLSD